ncbi:MAG: Phosphotransferase [Pseudomonadota bacterium]|nr:Phosphotransferase [Pseudomonadota bacterium]
MNHDSRLQQLQLWLEQILNHKNFSIAPASADASFRRYFRVTTTQQTWVAMDAPPDKENCEPFVHVAQMIEAAGVQAPHIYQRSQEQGFMLLSDLGSIPYLSKLDNNSADQLYHDAINSLIKMQTLQDGLPLYDAKLLQFEMSLCRDWYLDKHLQLKLSAQQQTILQNTFDLLTQNALQQPQVFVHRDYHSRNLMITATGNPGVIDFQDAVVGAVSYDLVSLLKDCYIAWPRQKIENWARYFLDHNPQTAGIPFAQFMRWFDLMGAQRHIKVLGIFARLNHRDGKPGYLEDIPRVLAYVFDTCARYEELHDLHTLLRELDVKPDAATLNLIRQ